MPSLIRYSPTITSPNPLSPPGFTIAACRGVPPLYISTTDFCMPVTTDFDPVLAPPPSPPPAYPGPLTVAAAANRHPVLQRPNFIPTVHLHARPVASATVPAAETLECTPYRAKQEGEGRICRLGLRIRVLVIEDGWAAARKDVTEEKGVRISGGGWRHCLGHAVRFLTQTIT